MGACAFVCAMLHYAAACLLGVRPRRSALLACLALAAACSFRLSVGPFFAPPLAWVLFRCRGQLPWRACAACALAFVAALVPSFLYNYVRTGNPLRPATAAPQYVAVGTADLSGNVFTGLYGLLLSPNKGLLCFSPVFALGLALPFVWRDVPPGARRLLVPFGVGAAGYVLFLANLRSWGTFGWGPRYLVPALPILFFLLAAALVPLVRPRGALVAALVVLSVAINLPTALVNWSLVLAEFPDASNPQAPRPYQQLAVWDALFLGLEGRPLPAGEEVSSDPVRGLGTQFPDLWTVHLMRHSGGGRTLGFLGLTLLAALAAGALRRVALMGRHGTG
jgi:hypothetical protein